MAQRWRVSSLIRNLLRKDRIERELDDELRAYLAALIEEHRRAGASPDAARRAALLDMQGLEQVKEHVRAARAGIGIERFCRDLWYGLRIAARHPGFSAAAVATLALGIGAATSTFTLVDTIVFRPLPYRDAGRLVKIWANASAEPLDNVSLREYQSIKDQSRVFEDVAADDGSDVGILAHGSGRQMAGGAIVTPQWLSTLGVEPVLGRGFRADEGEPGRNDVVVLTQEYWRRRFEADPRIIGTTVQIDGAPATIIGVLPANVLRYGADVLRPLVAADYPSDPSHRDLDVTARLRPGMTVAHAQAELDVVADRLARTFPETNRGRRFSVMTLDKYYAVVDPKATRGLTLAFGAVCLVLLIACVNVANLLLARGATRRRECLVRAAVGASRRRLISQLLIENLLLFLVGGAVGVILAWWTVDAVVTLAVTEGYVPQRMAVTLDARVVAFTMGLSLLTGLTFGLLPALRASRVDLASGLRDSSRTVGDGIGRSRTRRALIVAELTLSLVLLIGFGLMVRSVLGLNARAAGFDAARLLETVSDGGSSFPAAVNFWQLAVSRARTMPGVESVALASRPPLRGARTQSFTLDGASAPLDREPRAGDILVSADYFRTLAIPLVKGRPFTEQDTHASPPVVVISQSLAERHFRNQNPIGRRLRVNERAPMTCCSSAGPVENVWREIVGVVADIRQGNLEEGPADTIYRPFTQIVEHDMFLLVKARTAADVTRLSTGLTSELLSLHPGSQWSDVRPTEESIRSSESIRTRRFMLIVLGIFAGLALLLAAVGLYGVMSYFVVERRHEIAVRVALGATRSAVLAQVLGEAGRLAAAGLVLGGIAAHFLTRYISSLLFGIAADDLVTYLAVSAVLGAVSLLASYLPAHRAASVDPLLALKD